MNVSTQRIDDAQDVGHHTGKRETPARSHTSRRTVDRLRETTQHSLDPGAKPCYVKAPYSSVPCGRKSYWRRLTAHTIEPAHNERIPCQNIDAGCSKDTTDVHLVGSVRDTPHTLAASMFLSRKFSWPARKSAFADSGSASST